MIYEQFLVNESLPRYLKNAVKNDQRPHSVKAAARVAANIFGRSAGVIQNKTLRKSAIKTGKLAKKVRSFKDIGNLHKQRGSMKSAQALGDAADVVLKKYFGVK